MQMAHTSYDYLPPPLVGGKPRGIKPTGGIELLEVPLENIDLKLGLPWESRLIRPI